MGNGRGLQAKELHYQCGSLRKNSSCRKTFCRRQILSGRPFSRNYHFGAGGRSNDERGPLCLCMGVLHEGRLQG